MRDEFEDLGERNLEQVLAQDSFAQPMAREAELREHVKILLNHQREGSQHRLAPLIPPLQLQGLSHQQFDPLPRAPSHSGPTRNTLLTFARNTTSVVNHQSPRNASFCNESQSTQIYNRILAQAQRESIV